MLLHHCHSCQNFFFFQPPLYGSVKLSGNEVSEFTQDDLENGRITYAHTGPEANSGQVIEDDFKIKVTDGTHNKFFLYPDLKTSTRRSQRVGTRDLNFDVSREKWTDGFFLTPSKFKI